jgi:Zn-dependent peptidase ImmA (M78 family)
LGDPGAQLPQVAIGTDAERAAAIAREFLGVSTEAQSMWSSNFAALREWRNAFEESGILVFLMAMGAKSARGFSIWDDTAPVITVNTHWNAAARIYTLFHELGHLLTRTNSICANYSIGRSSSSSSSEIERWCEQFGAAALMPKDAVKKALDDFRVVTHAPVTDLDIPRRLAGRFHVSVRAATLRLIGLQRATWSLYRKIPVISDSKSGGGGGKGRTRAVARVDRYGRRATELFLRGLKRDVINAADVMHYFSVSYPEISQLEMLAS